MVIIFPRIGDGLRFDKSRQVFHGMGPGIVGDSASKMPCPAGKSADISGRFVSF